MVRTERVDPTTLAVVKGAIEQIVDEMDAIIVRTAFSPLISEQQDRASGVFDPQTGEVLAQGRLTLPMFMTAMQYGAQEVMAEAQRRGGFQAGDIYMINNPYTGGTHLPDVKVYAPVFFDEEIIAILGCTGHWGDIGGSTPGGFAPGATEIYQEGLIINAVPFQKAGEVQHDLLNLIFSNVRVEEERRGDFQAVLSGLHVGLERFDELIRRYPPATLLSVFTEMNDRSEQHMRSYLAEMPDGDYFYEDAVDNDGHSDEAFLIKVKVTIRGDEATFDFTGSSPPALGPINVPRSTTVCACQMTIKHLFPDVPVNGGCFRPFDYVIPDESFLAASSPRPTSGYLESVARVASTVAGALSSAIPERASGDLFGTTGAMIFSGKDSWMILPAAGGYGGNADGDGLVHGPTALGAANYPAIEALEQRIPVRVDRLELIEDSGGPGRNRGGPGSLFAYELMADDIAVVALGDRHVYPPFGILGGYPAKGADLHFVRDHEDVILPSVTKGRILLSTGDTVEYSAPGGGGYGFPMEREPLRVLRDVELGYVSLASAREDYGVVVLQSDHGLSIDETATAAVRKAV